MTSHGVLLRLKEIWISPIRWFYITHFAKSEFSDLGRIRDRLSVTAVDDQLGMTGSDESCAGSLEYVVKRFLRKIGELVLYWFPSTLSFGYLIRGKCPVGLLNGCDKKMRGRVVIWIESLVVGLWTPCNERGPGSRCYISSLR